jgi:hypothetical protein
MNSTFLISDLKLTYHFPRSPFRRPGFHKAARPERRW